MRREPIAGCSEAGQWHCGSSDSTVKRGSLGGGGVVPCGGGEEELVGGVWGGEGVSGDGVGHVRLDEDEEVIWGGVDAVDSVP